MGNLKYILICKRRYKADISNYRTRNLLSSVGKQCIRQNTTIPYNNNISRKPMKRASFRKYFSTKDHEHTVKQIIE